MLGSIRVILQIEAPSLFVHYALPSVDGRGSFVQPSVSKSSGHFLLIDGFLSSVKMHGLSHEYLLQAILPMMQSSDSFSDGINIFAAEESVCE